MFHVRTKNIEIHFHWIRGNIHDISINIKCLPAEDMIANVMTKSVDKGMPELFIIYLGFMDTLKSSNQRGFL